MPHVTVGETAGAAAEGIRERVQDAPPVPPVFAVKTIAALEQVALRRLIEALEAFQELGGLPQHTSNRVGHLLFGHAGQLGGSGGGQAATCELELQRGTPDRCLDEFLETNPRECHGFRIWVTEQGFYENGEQTRFGCGSFRTVGSWLKPARILSST